MRWAALLACCAILCLLVADRANAQDAPGKPAISTSVTQAPHTLTVTWTAPTSTGGTAITAYDLRYIRTDSPDKATDASWTVTDDVWVTDGGALSHQITGLRDETGYSIEVRAVNSTGDGAWSDTRETTTTDNVQEVGQLNGTHKVHITTKNERDRFTFTVTEATKVWFHTSGPVDTAISLWTIPVRTGQRHLAFNNTYRWVEASVGASIVYTLQPGVNYSLSTGSYKDDSTGEFDVHATILPDPGTNRMTAPTVTLGRGVRGHIGPMGGANGDSDYFKFVLDATTDVWIVALGHNRGLPRFPAYNMDTNIELLDGSGNLDDSVAGMTGTVLAMGDDAGWTRAIWTSDIRRRLSAGTYYVRVWGDDGYPTSHTGEYGFVVKEYQPPGSTRATAAPTEVYAYTPGNISSATDKDYFRITLSSQRYIDYHISERGHSSDTAHVPTFSAKAYDIDGNEIPLSITHRSGLFVDNVEITARVKAPAGVSYLEVTSNIASGDFVILPAPGPTLLQAFDDACDSGSQTDAYYTCQWHLNNTGQVGGTGQDINVEEVWATNKGEGMIIGIVDNGVQLTHEDLRENANEALSYDYHLLSPFTFRSGSSHATQMAGIAAARDNRFGVRGVAPRATFYSLNLAYSQIILSDSVDALNRNAAVTAVSSNSWSMPPRGSPFAPGVAWETAMERAVTTGYGGKGVVFVWAAGNDHATGDYANLSGMTNYHTVVTVCAIGHRDTRANYSNRGPSLWVCAPSNGFPGPALTSTESGNLYTDLAVGTSAATPVVSGVVALIRKANSALTWRDVKLILAASARKNHPTSSGWGQAGVKYGSTSTSDRYNYSHDYGFGAVDAGAAVALAADWDLVPEQRTIEATSNTLALAIGEAPRDGSPGTAATTSLALDSFVEFIEFIEVRVTLDHSSGRDLEIKLRSPSGAVSTLLVPLSRRQTSSQVEHPLELPDAFRLGSARHVGEDAAGTWTLTVTDRLRGNTGSLTSWSIKAYGHGMTPLAPPTPTATAGMRSLTVDWTAPTDPDGPTITSYDLRYILSSATNKAVPANWTVVTGIGTTDTVTYQVTSLGPGAQYDVQVRALADTSTGPWSGSLVVSTTKEKPFAPSLTRVTPRDVGLGAEWDAPTEDGGSEITSYDLRTIRSDATEAEKLVDSNWAETLSAWTAGDLQGRVASLTNGVEYDVQVRAENAIGEGVWSATLKGTPAIQNTDAAFADDTADREVAENLSVAGNVGARVAATDPDGDALTYSILGDHELFEIDAMNGQLSTKAALNYETATSHTLTVDVSDMLNSSDDEDPTIDDTIVVTIAVTDVNERPVVEGTRAITHAENEGRALAGASYSATDPEGANITWSVGGNDKGFFAISSGGVLSFAAEPDFDIEGDRNSDNIYEVTVQATEEDDGDALTRELTGELDVRVTLSDHPEPPEIIGPASVADFPENSLTTKIVGRRYTAEDPEGAGVTWSELSGNDAADFDLSNSGVLTFKRSPNFEMKDEYSVMLNAFDGDLTGSLDVTVTIANVNEPPVVRRRSGMGAFSIEENSRTTVGSFDADDPEGHAVTWSLETTGDHGRFEIDAANGALSFKELPDYESSDIGSDKAYNVTVRATEADDGDPQTRELWGRLAVTVAVTDVNEPPTITGNQTPSVAENTTAVVTYRATDPEQVAVTWSLQDGPGVFTISNTGALAFASAPNYEDQTEHTVTVRASDGTNDDDHDVTVTVTDVNEDEELTLSKLRPLIGEDYTAAFKQGTGDVVQSPTWAWERSTNPNSGPYADIIGATAATYRPVTADSGYYLRVTASYNDGHGQVRKTLQATSKLATAATSASNEPPAFPAPLFTGGVTGLSVPENATAPTLVGTVPQATDPESKPLRYSLAVSGVTTDPPFEINVTSRQIRVTGDAELNHEMRGTYSVTVTATDEFNATDAATFDITITDVNEPPVAVADPSVTTAEDTPVTFDVLGNDTDPDEGDTLTVMTITTQPRRGRVVADPATQMLTYTPAKDDHATYTFMYTARDDDPVRMLTSPPALVTVTINEVNDAPAFATPNTTRSVSEGAQPGDEVGTKVEATDVDDITLTYSLSGASDFVIDATGQIRVAPDVTLDRERIPSYEATVTATDRLNKSDSITVTINVSDVPEPPTADNDTATTDEDESVNIDVLDNDTDPDTPQANLRVSVLRQPLNGRARVESDRTITYTPKQNFADPDNPDSFTYRVSDGRLTDDGSVTVTVTPVNDRPMFPSLTTAARSVPEDAEAGDNVGAPVTATDVDENDTLTYRLDDGSGAFEIDPDSGQITVTGNVTLDTASPYHRHRHRRRWQRRGQCHGDRRGHDHGGWQSGGAATDHHHRRWGWRWRPSGPSPSTVDFEWTVTRDIEELDGGNDWSTGLWSDGRTLFIAENGQGADDEVYAYDLASGERLAEREFELAETNRAPRGFWSDGDTVWVSDSGRDRLFAYDLASGERQEQRELELADRNADARGVWSDGETVWVLDGSKNALFAYDLASGELLAEYALDSANGDPRGLWSDGLSVWVSDHGGKRLFAYRLPAAPAPEDAPDPEDAEATALERIRAEEFSQLSRASNNSPRGIWSDGDVMYVADESDDRVYSYNMPDAIDARLASLTLSGVDFGEFDSGRTEYEGVPGEDVAETTIAVAKEQLRATVVIEPPDADENTDGHQVSLDGTEITVTVTSADGSRTRVYRVQLEAPPSVLELSPTWTSIVWPGDDGVTIADALRGDGAEADITDRVIVIYRWDEATSTWLAFFPALADVPGLNTLTTLTTGATYWFAVSEPLSWTVPPAPATQ